MRARKDLLLRIRKNVSEGYRYVVSMQEEIKIIFPETFFYTEF